MTEALPKFSNPPVTEMVLGVEFAPISNWKVTHFGLFWQLIRDEYPDVEVQHPLPEQREKFGQQQQSTFTLDLSFQPQQRCWFSDESQTWLIQIQNSRFITNWKAGVGGYPGHDVVIGKFSSEWNRFIKFIKTENLQDPNPLQAEVTYINHIEDGGDFENIFSAWRGIKTGGFLPNPESITVNTVFVIPENRGRLYVSTTPVIRHSDMKLITQLSVTAKVLVASNSEDDMVEAIGLAHEWGVKGFKEITTEKMHEIWGKVK